MDVWLSTFHQEKGEQRPARRKSTDIQAVDGCALLDSFLLTGVTLPELPVRVRMWQAARSGYRPKLRSSSGWTVPKLSTHGDGGSGAVVSQEPVNALFTLHLAPSSQPTLNRKQMQRRHAADLTSVVLDIYIYALATLMTLHTEQRRGVATVLCAEKEGSASLDRALACWKATVQKRMVNENEAAWVSVVDLALRCWYDTPSTWWQWMEKYVREKTNDAADIRDALGECSAYMMMQRKGTAVNAWELILFSWCVATRLGLLTWPETLIDTVFSVSAEASSTAQSKTLPTAAAAHQTPTTTLKLEDVVEEEDKQQSKKNIPWDPQLWSVWHLYVMHRTLRTLTKRPDTLRPIIYAALDTLFRGCPTKHLPVLQFVPLHKYALPQLLGGGAHSGYVPFSFAVKREPKEEVRLSPQPAQETKEMTPFERSMNDRDCGGSTSHSSNTSSTSHSSNTSMPDWLQVDLLPPGHDERTSPWRLHIQQMDDGFLCLERTVDVVLRTAAQRANEAVEVPWVKQHAVISRAAVALALEQQQQQQNTQGTARRGQKRPRSSSAVLIEPAAPSRRRRSKLSSWRWCSGRPIQQWVRAPDKWWQALHLLDSWRVWHGVTSSGVRLVNGCEQRLPVPTVSSQQPRMTNESSTLRYPSLDLRSVNLALVRDTPRHRLTATLPLLVWELLGCMTLNVHVPALLVALDRLPAEPPRLPLPAITSSMDWSDVMGQRVHRFLASLPQERRPLYSCAQPLQLLPPTPLLVDETGRLTSAWFIPDAEPIITRNADKEVRSSLSSDGSWESASVRVNQYLGEQLPRSLADDIVCILRQTRMWQLDCQPRGVFYDSLSARTQLDRSIGQWLNNTTSEPATKERALLLHNLVHGLTDLFAS